MVGVSTHLLASPHHVPEVSLYQVAQNRLFPFLVLSHLALSLSTRGTRWGGRTAPFRQLTGGAHRSSYEGSRPPPESLSYGAPLFVRIVSLSQTSCQLRLETPMERLESHPLKGAPGSSSDWLSCSQSASQGGCEALTRLPGNVGLDTI